MLDDFGVVDFVDIYLLEDGDGRIPSLDYLRFSSALESPFVDVMLALVVSKG